MDLPTAFQPMLLKISGGIKKGILRPIQSLKLRACAQTGEGIFKIHLVIGFQEKLAPWLQDAGETAEEFLLINQTACGMTLFGPGIRTQQVQARYASCRQEPPGGVATF